MAIVEVTIVPLGTSSPSISSYVAACHKVLAGADGIEYQLTPMSTIIEGNFEIIKQLHEVPFSAGALRVSTTIRIDDRRDKPITMEGKLQSVMDKL